jgi:hypothetical protein
VRKVKNIRMQESYKRFIKTWIHFANPWIRTVSWPQILTPKRFDSYPTIRILDSIHKAKNLKLLDSEGFLYKQKIVSCCFSACRDQIGEPQDPTSRRALRWFADGGSHPWSPVHQRLDNYVGGQAGLGEVTFKHVFINFLH